ncbi:MAG: hypothetical protein EOL97_09615 [Spirochaetia bacterium]|nr:hypothetical protein [Spirochaetia bacterium]
MVNSLNIKDAEIYIGIIDTDEVDFSDRANNTTLASFVDAAITSEDITSFTKISDGTSELSLEPAEDDVSTTSFFGLDANGSQNSMTTSSNNLDVDITITKADEVANALKGFILEEQEVTNTTYKGYKSYNWGAKSSDSVLLFIRKVKTINGVEYYGNIAIIDPIFKKPLGFSGSNGDGYISGDLVMLGKKGNVFEDDYYQKGEVVETLVNFSDAEEESE